MYRVGVPGTVCCVSTGGAELCAMRGGVRSRFVIGDCSFDL